MIKLTLTVFTVLTLATAAYAQISPVTYKSTIAAIAPITIVAPKPEPETTEQTIMRLAKESGFQWPNYLLSLAVCEDDTLTCRDNKSGNHPATSIDRGCFMINDYWHPEVSYKQAHDLDYATNWSMKQINTGKQHEWVCNDTAKILAKTIKGDLYKMNKDELAKVVKQLKIEKSKSK